MVHVDLVELYKKKGKMIVGSVCLYCQWERVCSIGEGNFFFFFCWPNLSFHFGLLDYGYVLPYLKQLAKDGTSDDLLQTKCSVS